MSSSTFFVEDSIYRINPDKSVEFGQVVRGAGCSHGVLDGPVPGAGGLKKRLAVLWGPRGHTGMVATDKVKLLDRAFLPGDHVTRDRGAGRLGYILKRRVVAAVRICGTDRVITSVNTTDLEPLESVSTNMVVYYDGRVGLVLEVKRELTVRFADGSVCIVKHEDTDYFQEVLGRGRCAGVFYRGQRLLGPVRCFENAHFLHRTDANKILMSYAERAPLQVIVDYVTVVQLTVQDICVVVPLGVTSAVRVIQGRALERVRVVNGFEPCAVQMGDHNYYKIKESDCIISLEDWQSQCASKYSHAQDRGDENPGGYENPVPTGDWAGVTAYAAFGHSSMPLGLSPLRRSRVFRRGKPSHLARGPSRVYEWVGPSDQPSLEPGSLVATEVLTTTSTVEVIWEDGSVETDIPATQLQPGARNESTFLLGKFVVENTDNAPADRYGVVKSFDHSAKTAVVGMFKIDVNTTNPVEVGEEEMSLYDIKEHPTFKFVPGSCVLRLTDHREGPEWMVGQVSALYPADGAVEVRWVAGWVSLCYPHELYHMGRYEHLWLSANEEADDELAGEEGAHIPPQIVVVSVPMGPSGGLVVPPTYPVPTAVPTAIPLGPSSAPVSIEVEAAGGVPPVGVPQGVPGFLGIPAFIGMPGTKGWNDPGTEARVQVRYLELSVSSVEHNTARDPSRQTCASLRRMLDLYYFYRRLPVVADIPYLYQRILRVLVQSILKRSRPVPRRLSARLRQLITDYLASAPPPDEDPATEEGETETPKMTQDDDHQRQAKWRSLDLRELCELLNKLLEHRIECSRKKYEALLPQVPDVAVQPDSEAAQGKAEDGDPEWFELRYGRAKGDNAAEGDGAKDDDGGEVEAKDDAEKAAGNGVKEDAPGKPCQGVFTLVEAAPDSHRFKLSPFNPNNPREFSRAVKKELKLLMTSLPDGIHVKSYEDRMDLFSVMIRGPRHTPYEDALFIFELRLPSNYPWSPPLCHYMSFSKERLNPNLYEDGKVCLSLLGTWPGEKAETWSPGTSNLLQLLVSIQGLILVAEPYFNEPGFERERGTAAGRAKSRQYNEVAFLLVVQAMVRMLKKPPEVFKDEIKQHMEKYGLRFVSRREAYLDTASAFADGPPEGHTCHGCCCPGFPLLPATRGFQLSLRNALDNFLCARLANLGQTTAAPDAGK